MRDYIEIGSAPHEENCAQVGEDNYAKQARIECQAFLNQIKRDCGEPPQGAILSVKSFPHDFGSYLEVVVYFYENNEEAVNYAFAVESDAPAKWDEQAKKELNET